VVENIRISNIIMEKVICPFVINMYYRCGASEKDQWVWEEMPYPVSEGTPGIRDIHFSSITVREAGAAAGYIAGLAEMPVERISFSDVDVEMAENPSPGKPAMIHQMEAMRKQGLFLRHAREITFDHVRIRKTAGAMYQLKDSRRVEFAGCMLRGTDPGIPSVILDHANEVIFYGCQTGEEKTNPIKLLETSPDSVIFQNL
jgi:polygalacturonase